MLPRNGGGGPLPGASLESMLRNKIIRNNLPLGSAIFQNRLSLFLPPYPHCRTSRKKKKKTIKSLESSSFFGETELEQPAAVTSSLLRLSVVPQSDHPLPLAAAGHFRTSTSRQHFLCMTLNPLPAGPYQVGPLSLGRAGVPRDVFCPCRFDYILAWSREEVGKKSQKTQGNIN